LPHAKEAIEDYWAKGVETYKERGKIPFQQLKRNHSNSQSTHITKCLLKSPTTTTMPQHLLSQTHTSPES